MKVWIKVLAIFPLFIAISYLFIYIFILFIEACGERMASAPLFNTASYLFIYNLHVFMRAPDVIYGSSALNSPVLDWNSETFACEN